MVATGKSIQLKKGNRINLQKDEDALKYVLVGLGWDIKSNASKRFDYDLDASAFMLKENGKLLEDEYFIFYNNLISPDKSVQHSGDNRTGQGAGDDELIKVDLSKVNENVDKILFTVTIHDAKNRGQNFGQVENAYVRLIDGNTDEEIARFDLEEEFSTANSMLMCEIYRNNGIWKLNALGEAFSGDLQALVDRYI